MNLLSSFLTGLLGVGTLGVSLRWHWWRRPKKGIPILMYHKVGLPPVDSKLKKLWVTPAKFRRQMTYIKKHGYRPIVFSDLYRHWDQGSPLPGNPMLITFDDGYENNYKEAFPILKEFNFPATLFVVTGTVGKENVWHNPQTEGLIKMVSWASLKELKKAGWEIGSHTLDHFNLTKLRLEEVKVQLAESREIIGKELGEVPQTFAYPYGAGADDQAIRQITKEVGYRVALSVHTGKWSLDQIQASPYCLPRVFIRGDDNMLDFHLHLTRGQSRF